MSGFNYVKKETLEQMKIELQRMKSVDRPAASKAIAEAKEKGDEIVWASVEKRSVFDNE